MGRPGAGPGKYKRAEGQSFLCFVHSIVQGFEVEAALAGEGDSEAALAGEGDSEAALAGEGDSEAAGEVPLKVLAVGEEEEEAALVCEAESRSSLNPIVTKASFVHPPLSVPYLRIAILFFCVGLKLSRSFHCTRQRRCTCNEEYDPGRFRVW